MDVHPPQNGIAIGYALWPNWLMGFQGLDGVDPASAERSLGAPAASNSTRPCHRHGPPSGDSAARGRAVNGRASAVVTRRTTQELSSREARSDPFVW